MTLDKYLEMFAKQKHRCGICDTVFNKLPVNLAVDHCHSTGQIRGLLCVSCNTAIGSFKDNIELLNKAVKYLTHHNGEKNGP